MKRWLLIGTLSAALMLLSGCATLAPRLIAAWFTIDSVETSPLEPSREPVETVVLSPQAEQVVGTVRQMLMQQTQADFDAIELVTVEAMDWSDGCLGLGRADEMCLQAIVPGYRVVLAVDGQEYVYRTNADASMIRLEAAPEARLGEVWIAWTSPASDGFCTALEIGSEGIAFGACYDTRMPANLANPERDADLAEFVATFAPFEADTPAGHVVFHGQGSQQASAAEQRMIAEWARLVQLEAVGGRSGASWGLAFAWHREGGIAGFCDDLTVYVTGQVYASSCKGNTPTNLGETRLDVDQLAQLYTWIDGLQNFEVEQSDPATAADAMTMRMVFSGAGDTVADAAQQQAILDFAAQLFADLSQ